MSTHTPTTWHSDPHHTSTQHFVHCDNFLTLRPCDIFLLWHFDSVTIFYCNTLTMWHFATVTFWLSDNFLLRHFDHVTFFSCDIFLLWHFSPVTIFYCDIPTLWQFSTVTFRLKVDRLSVHPKKWTFCHTDILTHCNIGQPMAVTFFPLRILISTVATLSKLLLFWTDDDLLTLSL